MTESAEPTATPAEEAELRAISGRCLNGTYAALFYEIGPARREGSLITVELTLTSGGPERCEFGWASDLSIPDEVYLQSAGGWYPLTDATGVLALDGPLYVADEYIGSWIFDVGDDRGPFEFFHPDFDESVPVVP